MLRKQSKNAKITISILFAFIGVCLICYTYFDSIKDNLYSHKNLDTIQEVIEFDEDAGQKLTLEPEEEVPELPTGKGRYDYIGILKVPSVGIERGFTAFDNPYNYVDYNVQLIESSSMPDVDKGNLILAAHKGTSSVSYFGNLHNIQMGANASITYRGKVYTYKLVNSYNVAKDGTVEVSRNRSKTVLTLITCTHLSSTEQTVYIFELESVVKE